MWQNTLLFTRFFYAKLFLAGTRFLRHWYGLIMPPRKWGIPIKIIFIWLLIDVVLLLWNYAAHKNDDDK